MTTDNEIEHRIADWLEDGPLEPPSWAVDDAVRAAAQLPQRRSTPGRWRDPMQFPVRVLATVVTVAAVAVLAFALLPSGHGVGGGSPTPTSAMSSPSASPSPSTLGLDGTYEGDIGSTPAGVLAGHWRITFVFGQLFYQNPLGGQISQVVAIVGPNTFTLTPDDCPTGTGPGRYDWSLKGSILTLTKVSDPSACRADTLTGTPWTRAPGQ